jgi:hypothetical protein
MFIVLMPLDLARNIKQPRDFKSSFNSIKTSSETLIGEFELVELVTILPRLLLNINAFLSKRLKYNSFFDLGYKLALI